VHGQKQDISNTPHNKGSNEERELSVDFVGEISADENRNERACIGNDREELSFDCAA
jgi:hypothetical protein